MGESEGGSEREMIEILIFAVLAMICVALYFIWRTQLEILRMLRLLNVKFLNAALFVRPESSAQTERVQDRETKPN